MLLAGLAVVVGCDRSPSSMPSAAPDTANVIDRYAVRRPASGRFSAAIRKRACCDKADRRERSVRKPCRRSRSSSCRAASQYPTSAW